MALDVSHRLVFVGGLHRSGTTPLARAIGAHHSVSAFADTGVKEDEGQHLQNVYPPAREYGGAGRFALDPRAHLTEASPLVSTESADRLLEQWSSNWDDAAPVWLEKSPPNLIMTRFLQALFPEARFVVIMRHPLIVALSTSKWVGSRPLSDLMEHWLRAYELFREDARSVEHIQLVRYEELVADPSVVLGDVASFIGLDGSIPADSFDSARSDAYAERWRAMSESRLPWRSSTAQRLVATYADRVAAFGYDMGDLATTFDAARSATDDE
ncbi:sulfotransferase family protein [Solicola gregarius]|uniref:Sulfotransferase n=1 Tax=Solicola gregarius TaxID=2908642 RepID=A0AA46TK21_9ACTN|nr:sulfotransferase [Solicola gregarius]UYM06558.1 sulfotransferase [Solicola gregarius]